MSQLRTVLVLRPMVLYVARCDCGLQLGIRLHMGWMSVMLAHDKAHLGMVQFIRAVQCIVLGWHASAASDCRAHRLAQLVWPLVSAVQLLP
jgi:hypothetical protein